MTTNGLLNTMQSLCRQPCSAVRCWKWDVPQVISIQNRQHHKYAVLVLNRPISQGQNFMKNFWNNASIRVTVDGGTTQWDMFVNKLSEDTNKSMKLPDLVTGDFDSITEEILQKYKKKGCKTVHTPDQMHTDFTKALIELHKYCLEHNKELDHVVAIGQSSGRIDQILGNIQSLFLVKEKHLLDPKSRVYLMSDDALSWLLYPGDHVIIVPQETLNHRRTWCSMVPVGEPCDSVTTTGLKWNLDKGALKFGDLVSTSNTFDGSEKVTVKCSHTLLWSMKIPSLGS